LKANLHKPLRLTAFYTHLAAHIIRTSIAKRVWNNNKTHKISTESTRSKAAAESGIMRIKKRIQQLCIREINTTVCIVLQFAGGCLMPDSGCSSALSTEALMDYEIYNTRGSHALTNKAIERHKYIGIREYSHCTDKLIVKICVIVE
jgi:hypothetical protein